MKKTTGIGSFRVWTILNYRSVHELINDDDRRTNNLINIEV